MQTVSLVFNVPVTVPPAAQAVRAELTVTAFGDLVSRPAGSDDALALPGKMTRDSASADQPDAPRAVPVLPPPPPTAAAQAVRAELTVTAFGDLVSRPAGSDDALALPGKMTRDSASADQPDAPWAVPVLPPPPPTAAFLPTALPEAIGDAVTETADPVGRGGSGLQLAERLQTPAPATQADLHPGDSTIGHQAVPHSEPEEPRDGPVPVRSAETVAPSEKSDKAVVQPDDADRFPSRPGSLSPDEAARPATEPSRGTGHTRAPMESGSAAALPQIAPSADQDRASGVMSAHPASPPSAEADLLAAITITQPGARPGPNVSLAEMAAAHHPVPQPAPVNGGPKAPHGSRESDGPGLLLHRADQAATVTSSRPDIADQAAAVRAAPWIPADIGKGRAEVLWHPPPTDPGDGDAAGATQRPVPSAMGAAPPLLVLPPRPYTILTAPAFIPEPDRLSGLADEIAPLSAPWQAGSTSAPGAAPALPGTPGAVPQLLVAMLGTLAQRPGGTTEIALSPAELGGVSMSLRTDPDDPERMVVMLAFDRPETMDLFRRHADQLTEALRSAGYARAEIDFGQTATGGFASGRSGPDTPAAADSPSDTALRGDIPGDPPSPSPDRRRAASATSLDLRL